METASSNLTLKSDIPRDSRIERPPWIQNLKEEANGKERNSINDGQGFERDWVLCCRWKGFLKWEEVQQYLGGWVTKSG